MKYSTIAANRKKEKKVAAARRNQALWTNERSAPVAPKPTSVVIADLNRLLALCQQIKRGPRP